MTLPEWKDRRIERENTYKVLNNKDGTVTLIPVTGEIYESGTPLNALNLNKINAHLEQKAENIRVNKLENQLKDFVVEQSQGMTDTGSLELKAIRTNIQGDTFGIASERIDNIENIIINNIGIVVLNNWEIGAISQEGEEISTYPRIRSDFYFMKNKEITIEINEGYKANIYEFDKDEVFVNRVTNITSSQNLKIQGDCIRVVLGRNDDVQPELSECNNIKITYTFDTANIIEKFSKTHGKNICPNNFYKSTVLGDSNSGYILNNNSTVSNPVTYIFPCEGATEYTLTIKTNKSDRFRIFSSNIEELEFGKTYQNSNFHAFNITDTLNTLTFTTNSDDKWIIAYVNANGDIPEWIQCEKGIEFTGYEEYIQDEYLDLKENKISPNNLDLENTYRGNIISNIITKNYEPDSQYIDWDLTGGDYLNKIYTMWDSLVTEYPEYITKKTAGTDATGLPIYRYDLFTKSPQGYLNNLNKTKILYLGGVHGHERKNMVEDFRFFKELCERRNENETLKMLYDNVYFIVIPAVCPWGVNNLKRVNSNSVNINRNFPTNWRYIANDSNYNYSGETPASELETQAIIKILDYNPDIAFVIDHHNSSSFEDQGYIIFASSNKEIDRRLSFSTFNRLDSKIKSKYTWITTDNVNNKNKNIYMVNKTVTTGTLYNEVYYKGMHGMLLETAPTHGATQYPNGSEQDIQAITIETIGSLLETIVLNNNLLIK